LTSIVLVGNGSFLTRRLEWSHELAMVTRLCPLPKTCETGDSSRKNASADSCQPPDDRRPPVEISGRVGGHGSTVETDRASASASTVTIEHLSQSNQRVLGLKLSSAAATAGGIVWTDACRSVPLAGCREVARSQ
jgi:hypothetical protein